MSFFFFKEETGPSDSFLNIKATKLSAKNKNKKLSNGSRYSSVDSIRKISTY